MDFVSRITLKSDQTAAVLFIDDTDIITESKDAQTKMQEILKICNNLYSVTGGHIEEKKCKYFTWRYRQKQENKVIENQSVNIEVNQTKVQCMDCKKSERSLGVYMSPYLVWNKQFKIMKEKMRKEIFKLKNTEIVITIAHLYYNMYLIIKVYFGCSIIHLMEQ